MEISDSNLQTLSQFLTQTLSSDPAVRKPAEAFLESVEGNQNYPLLLLNLLDKTDVGLSIRVSSAITFKNYVKRNWRKVDEVEDKIHISDRNTVKHLIVGLMLKSPEQIQKQLSDAISIIGREDFPKDWPDLIAEMVSKFQTGDFHIINGVLRTAHSLFKRYRHEFKSQELWAEIKFVLDNFAAPFTELFCATMELAKTHANEPSALKVIFSSILLECKIFYSLNFQDLPEHFEDNMGTWMTNFLTLLNVDNKLLQTEDEAEAGLLEQVKSQISDNVTLYAQKYDEEFSPHLPAFVTAIWNLLVTTGQEVKYDMLVSNAIQFLASVAERPGYKGLFEDPSTLASICEKVIIPNMQFRSADEELFEDNPEEYIRRDIEGSDVDTRRRAACDLVQALCKSFEGPVIQNFSQYVQALLQEYAGDTVGKWKSKDSAIYLITSLAAKAQTQKYGITQTSGLVNISDFFTGHILPDIRSIDVNAMPVLKADAIKYLMVFRNQLPREALLDAFPHLIHYLQASSLVVHTYAAHCIERHLMVKTSQGTPALMENRFMDVSLGELLNLTQGKEVGDQHIFQKHITCAEVILCQLIVNMNLSLSTSDKSMEAMKNMFPDSKIAQGMMIQWKNCISLGSASVMTGKKKGVSSFVEKEQPEVFLSACTPHLVYLAAKRGVEHLLMRITFVDVQSCANDLVNNLFGALQLPRSAENEYVMKAIMRTMSMMQEHLVPMIPQLLKLLTDKLIIVSKNPSKPHFNHYLFESLCILIRTTCKKDPELVTEFETNLFQPFTEILQLDIQEFIPYVFQILSLLIELHNKTVPETYMALFPHLLTPVLWERPGNIPPLVRLLQAYIEKGAKQIEPEKLSGLLGIFQKLVASKVNDHEGFYLLNSIIEHMPHEIVSQYIKQIFILLFQRLQSSKTTKYIKSLLVFFCLYCIQYSAASLVEIIDGIQAKMFSMVVEKLYLQDLQKVSGTTEKKICAAGVLKILTEASIMLTDYKALWPKLLQALIGLFELPEDDSIPDDEHFIEVDETPGYQTAYSQLAFAGKKEHDPVGDSVPQLKMRLVKHLEKLASQYPGKLLPLINTGMQQEAQTYLQGYMQLAGVNLA